MKDFRDLRVWDEAHRLTLKIYRATSRFPAGRTVWAHQSDASVHCVDRCQHRQNAAGNGVQRIPALFGKLPQDQRVSWITNSSWRRTWSTWTNPPITPCMKIFPRLRRMLNALLQKVDGERSVAKC
jgi:hypothetical protein